MKLTFEWDKRKATSNQRKHRVCFEEAIAVFDNHLTRIFDDEEHSSEDEQREIAIGHSVKNRLLLVIFHEHGPNVVRIISARSATKKERKNHEENAAC